MSESTLENCIDVKGNLYNAYRAIEPGTMFTSSQIASLRNRDSYYTSNFSMYTVEKGQPILYFGEGDELVNPILNNLQKATINLRVLGVYICTPEDMSDVIASVKSGLTARIKMSELKLNEDLNSTYSTLEVSTSKFDRMNKTKRLFCEKIYGTGNDFKDNMEWFNTFGVQRSNIAVLNPTYVKKVLSEGDAIAFSCLYTTSFPQGDIDSVDDHFFDSVNTADSHDCFVRGRRL